MKEEFSEKKEISCKDNMNRRRRVTCEVYSKLCNEERGLKEELGKAETNVIQELRALAKQVHYLC